MRKRSEAKKPRARTRAREREEEIPTREFTLDVPNDPANEQVILASMMVDTETCDRLLPLCPTDAFYAEEHKIIREGLALMRRKKLTYDPATFLRLVPNADITLLEQYPTARPDVPDNLDFHVETLLWDRQRAQFAKGAFASMMDAIQNPKETPERVRALARQIGKAFEGEIGRARFLRDPKTLVHEMMTEVRKRAKGEAHYPYGINGLDYYEDGSIRMRPACSPGTMSLVTALSGSGKSTFVAHLALASARKRRKVLFGAWEEEDRETIESLAVLALGWNRQKILDGESHIIEGKLRKEELIKLEETAHKISEWIIFFKNPFQIDSDSEASNDAHLDIIEEHIEASGCDVFIADLLHRCLVEDTPSDEKRFLFRLLSIVQRTKVHHIAAHQQRAKDIETRKNKEPTREGIIGAGAWLDVFWTVMAPHLPAKWKNVPDNTLELFILKQRKGKWPLGIEFQWDGECGSIEGGTHFDVKSRGETSDDLGFAPVKRVGPRGKRGS